MIDEIKKLKSDNLVLINVVEAAYKDIENINKACKLAGLHPFTLLKKDLEDTLRKFGKINGEKE